MILQQKNANVFGVFCGKVVKMRYWLTVNNSDSVASNSLEMGMPTNFKSRKFIVVVLVPLSG